MVIQEENLLKGLKILVLVSGSIAAVKTPLLVSLLIKGGAEVKTVITPSASKLVSPLSLATLSRSKCFQDKDQWDPSQHKPLHIDLAEWADIITVAPLTASTLARWVSGLGDNLIASLLLAFEGPVVVAAAMNTAMWGNSYVKKNWKEIKNDPNVLCLSPTAGVLACDRLGDGKMAEPELIELAIKNCKLQIEKYGSLQKDLKGLNILVTAGPTKESIDPARVITNQSSGRMGVLIAQAARFRGAKVELVHGPLDIPNAWLEGLKIREIETAEEMQMILQKGQNNFDALIMAAAIADFKAKNGAAKEKANKKNLLQILGESLEEVPDLLKELVKRKNSRQVLVGFAALSGSDQEIRLAAKAKKISKGCDLLMANPIDRNDQGFGNRPNGGFLIGPDEKVQIIQKTSKIALAHQLIDSLIEIYKNISIKI